MDTLATVAVFFTFLAPTILCIAVQAFEPAPRAWA